MKFLFAILIGTLAIFGASLTSTPKSRPTGKWTPLEGFSPTENDQRVVKVARRYLEMDDFRRNLDFQYKVELHEGDYWVYVQYVFGCDDAREPIMMPGGFCTVVITKALVVKRVIGGA